MFYGRAFTAVFTVRHSKVVATSVLESLPFDKFPLVSFGQEMARGKNGKLGGREKGKGRKKTETMVDGKGK